MHIFVDNSKGTHENNIISQSASMENDNKITISITDFATDNKNGCESKKHTSLAYSDILSKTGRKIYRKYRNRSQEKDKAKKLKIERVYKSLTRQNTCCDKMEFVLSEKNKTHQKHLLTTNNCGLRGTCRICSSNQGNKFTHLLTSFFHEINITKNVVAYPFTWSPPNFATIEEGHKGCDNIMKNFKKMFETTYRGNENTKLARQQLNDNCVAWFATKEVELGTYENGWLYTCTKQDIPHEYCLLEHKKLYLDAHRSGLRNQGTINMHWHGILYMELDSSGSYKKTFSFSSFKDLINHCNNGVHCSNQIGDTKNGRKPIDINDDDGIEAFLEVTKYLMKLPTRQDFINSITNTKEDFQEAENKFNKQMEFVWDVFGESYKAHFKRKGGALINYRPPSELDTDVPDKAMWQSLTRCRDNANKYKEELSRVDSETLRVAWVLILKQDRADNKRRNLKTTLEEILHIGGKEEKIKSLKKAIKGLVTYSNKLTTKIEKTIQKKKEEDIIFEENMYPKIEGLAFPWQK